MLLEVGEIEDIYYEAVNCVASLLPVVMWKVEFMVLVSKISRLGDLSYL